MHETFARIREELHRIAMSPDVSQRVELAVLAGEASAKLTELERRLRRLRAYSIAGID